MEPLLPTNQEVGHRVRQGDGPIRPEPLHLRHVGGAHGGSEAASGHGALHRRRHGHGHRTNAISTRAQDTELTITGGSGGTVVNGALDVLGTLTSGSVELSTELRAPTVRARATDDYLTLTGGTQGTSSTPCSTPPAIRADNGIVSSPAYLELIGGSTGCRHRGICRLCPPSTAATSRRRC